MDAELINTIGFFAVIGAVLFLLGAGVALSLYTLAWVKNGERPRERVVLLVRGFLGFLVIHGLILILGGGYFFLAAQVFQNQLTVTERDQFVRSMWFCLGVGSGLAVVAAAGLRLTRQFARRLGV
jgi:hypothetical protein